MVMIMPLTGGAYVCFPIIGFMVPSNNRDWDTLIWYTFTRDWSLGVAVVVVVWCVCAYWGMGVESTVNIKSAIFLRKTTSLELAYLQCFQCLCDNVNSGFGGKGSTLESLGKDLTNVAINSLDWCQLACSPRLMCWAGEVKRGCRVNRHCTTGDCYHLSAQWNPQKKPLVQHHWATEVQHDCVTVQLPCYTVCMISYLHIFFCIHLNVIDHINVWIMWSSPISKAFCIHCYLMLVPLMNHALEQMSPFTDLEEVMVQLWCREAGGGGSILTATLWWSVQQSTTHCHAQIPWCLPFLAFADKVECTICVLHTCWGRDWACQNAESHQMVNKAVLDNDISQVLSCLAQWMKSARHEIYSSWLLFF